jgi:hypothetical protein
MGYDASYHPISEEEIYEWYFSKVADLKNGSTEAAGALAKKQGIDDFYVNKYLNVLSTGAKTEPTKSFEKTHGFFVAVTQGFFRKYFYTRGALFTTLIENNSAFQRYTKPWQEILRTPVENPIKNLIIENYSSGVYIPFDKLRKLQEDYNHNPEVKAALDKNYSYQRIDVFLKAIQFAIENELGLLEATEVVEPNPLELNKSESYSNLFNCDKEGPLLYQEAAMEQLKQIKQREAAESQKGNDNAADKSQVEQAPKADASKKPGFFARLLGRTPS